MYSLPTVLFRFAGPVIHLAAWLRRAWPRRPAGSYAA